MRQLAGLGPREEVQGRKGESPVLGAGELAGRCKDENSVWRKLLAISCQLKCPNNSHTSDSGWQYHAVAEKEG